MREIIGYTEKGWAIFNRYETTNSHTGKKYTVTEAYDENGYERVVGLVVEGSIGNKSLTWPDAGDAFKQTGFRWERSEEYGKAKPRYQL